MGCLLALAKTLAVRILEDTWDGRAVPQPLLNVQHSRRYEIDVLFALMFTALWTRPPVQYGPPHCFSKSVTGWGSCLG